MVSGTALYKQVRVQMVKFENIHSTETNNDTAGIFITLQKECFQPQDELLLKELNN